MPNQHEATTPVPDRHTHSSTHREQILEHHFVADLLRYLWQHYRDEELPEVTYSDVDNSGYDLVIEWKEVQRHIQLKSSISTTSSIRVNASLSRKASGCVVLMECNDDLSDVKYRWFGNAPRQMLDLKAFKRATHTRRNGGGVKQESISARIVPRGKFIRVGQIGNLVQVLFLHPTDNAPVPRNAPDI
jgi:hypothetical protein